MHGKDIEKQITVML